MTSATKLRSKSKQDLYHALAEHISDVPSRCFNMPTIKCDSESEVVALRDPLGENHRRKLKVVVGENEHVLLQRGTTGAAPATPLKRKRECLEP